MKKRYGESHVLNIATFSTEQSRSALLSAARGMGIDSSEIGYLTSLIPVERGFSWTLKEAFGLSDNPDKKGVKELINAVAKWDELAETALRLEGLIRGVSVHASGIYVYEDTFDTHNACMRVSSGQLVTQLDMGDSDQCSGLKVDSLTTAASDRIRKAMDMLIEQGFLEDKGNLKDNYDAHIHPDVLNYEDKGMWDKVAKMEIPDLFQFETATGSQCAKKAKPQNILELATINSLMRLMPEGGEQPIDKFVRHKKDISQWYDEMKRYNLTEDEIKVMEDHVGKSYGIGESQEKIMLMLLDERLCGMDLTTVNYVRKVIGKKLMSDIPKVKELVFNTGAGSKNLKQYFWDTQVAIQLGYSFSDIHSHSYGLIALQEMNLAHFYPRIFWDTACLTVSAGADEHSEKNKATDYSRVAISIGRMSSHDVKVTYPLINKANFGFTPDVENNQIIYGLKGINGVNDDLIHTLLDNRPYSSFEDFYQRIYDTKIATKGQMINLIKAGVFNEFDSQVEIMKKFIVKEVDVKESLNGQNIPKIINLGLFNTPDYQHYKDYYNFRKHLIKKVHQRLEKPKNRIFLLDDDYGKTYFQNNFSEESIVGYHGNGLLIDEKLFNKEYEVKMNPVKELLQEKDFIRSYNIGLFHEIWNELAKGSVSSWEMDSLSYYAGEHELAHIDKDKYGIRNFNELSETPVVLGERTSKNGRTYQDLELYTIVGTVIEKNSNSHSFTLLTDTGVVTCKTHSGSYSFYDRQIKIDGKIAERSYFSRGTLLMLSGYRRQDQFVLKAPYGQHTIHKITEIRPDNTLGLQSERIRH